MENISHNHTIVSLDYMCCCSIVCHFPSKSVAAANSLTGAGAAPESPGEEESSPAFQHLYAFENAFKWFSP